MNGIGHDRGGVGEPAADELNDAKPRIEKKSPADPVATMTMLVHLTQCRSLQGISAGKIFPVRQ